MNADNLVPLPEKTNPTVVEFADPIQIRLARLVNLYRRAPQQRESLRRELCRLAYDLQLEAEEFRQRLLHAKMPASRASELKCVYASSNLVEYLKGRYSWREYLRAARQSQLGPIFSNDHRATAERGLSSAQRHCLAQIAGLLHRYQLGEAESNGWQLSVSYRFGSREDLLAAPR